MGLGFDLDEWISGEELQVWRDYVQSHLGWFHYLGGRPLGPNSGENHAPWQDWNDELDYASYEHHEPDIGVYVAALQNLPDLPVMSEDRFRVRGENGPGKDYTYDQTRRGLWHSMMAGGVANIWGNLTTADGRTVSSPSEEYPNREETITFNVFFNERGRFTLDLVGDANIGGLAALRSASGDRAVVYVEDADSIELDLSGLAATLSAVAVDARLQYAEVNLGLLDNDLQTISLPYESDWGLAIGEFSGNDLIFVDGFDP